MILGALIQHTESGIRLSMRLDVQESVDVTGAQRSLPEAPGYIGDRNGLKTRALNSADTEAVRRRQATANRVLTVLKTALNRRAVPLSPATITCRVTSRRVSVRRHRAGIPRRHPRKRAGGRPR
jgi:hypothetical protein